MQKRSIRLSSATKKRVWTCVVYPESLPANWIDELKQSGLKCSCSPLHDRDYNADNTKKKAHYHLILVYNSPTTFNNVSNFSQGVLHGTIPQPLESVEGMYRYFTHRDNPEKAQYNEIDIQSFNGFNIYDFVEIKKSEFLKLKKELQHLIIDNNIVEYCDFMDFVINSDNDQYYDVASSNTIFFNNYIASRRHSAEKKKASESEL